MTARQDNRIDEVLHHSTPGLWPFLAVGYPTIEATARILRGLNDLPIRGVELGIPFSDPIADGPVIQHAFSEALDSGLRLSDAFDMVSALRADFRHPLLAMVSASVVYRVGVEMFVSKAQASGFDGLIVPDLSLEESPVLARLASEAGLRLSMLVAPTTPDERRGRIAEVASGFLYYVSVQGTTGARKDLPAVLERQVRSVRQATGLKVLVGFGIGRAEQVRQICGFADGAIVGSAIVKKATDLHEGGASEDEVTRQIIRFVGELSGA